MGLETPERYPIQVREGEDFGHSGGCGAGEMLERYWGVSTNKL